MLPFSIWVQKRGQGLLPRPLAGGWVDPARGGQPSVKGTEGGTEQRVVVLGLPHEVWVALPAEAPGDGTRTDIGGTGAACGGTQAKASAPKPTRGQNPVGVWRDKS